MNRRTFLATATAAVGVSGFAPAVGAPLDLNGYRTVFNDGFRSFEPFHPISNPMGHWAVAGARALDGSIRDTAARRPYSLEEIDADPELMLRHRAPEHLGDYSIFTDASLAPGLDPFRFEPGRLTMTAREIPPRLRPLAAGRRYMAPRIWLTQGGLAHPFLYGYFEARITLDVANSTYAAFWLLSDKGWTGEIDIMEYLGQWSEHPRLVDKYLTSAHADWGARDYGAQIEGPAINGRTRRFGCDWSAERLDFYLDRRLVRSIPNPDLHMPMYPILHMGVATPLSMTPYRSVGGGLPDTSRLPMTMAVERVLVAQRAA